jgi:hypothetical protein
MSPRYPVKYRAGMFHASRERHRKMSEVPTDTAAFLMALRGGAVPPGMVVAELEAVMGVVTDRLCSLPAALDAAKERPGQVRQFFGVAVAASRKGRTSPGSSAMSHCCADGLTSSGRPLSSTMNSLRTSRRPGGATNRVQMLP